MKLALLVATAVFVFGSAAATSIAAQETAHTIGAKDSPILLLPALEKSGRTGKEKEEFIRAAMDVLRKDASNAGFPIVEKDPEAVAMELGINLADDEQRTRANYGRLAHSAGARLVVAPVILAVESGLKSNLLYAQKRGKARVELAIFDAEESRFLTKDNFDGEKKGNVVAPNLDKSSSQRIGALSAAFHNGFTAFTKAIGLTPPKPGKKQ